MIAIDAATAAIAAVVVTQAGNGLAQYILARRSEAAAAAARTAAATEAEKQRLHELKAKRLELDVAAIEALRAERSKAYRTLGQEAWALARLAGVHQPTPGHQARLHLDVPPSEDEQRTRENQIARTRDALWPVLQLGGFEVGLAGESLVDWDCPRNGVSGLTR